MSTQILEYQKPFVLESGVELPGIHICYTTHGSYEKGHSNVIWIFHALTANSDPAEWWDGLVGIGKAFDPEKYFIVCANNLGSCYGTTGASSAHPKTGEKYGKSFPLITIRDMVKVNDIVRQHLGIEKIKLVTGGSMGGQMALEWAIQNPDVIENLVPIATNAKHSAWGIAYNEAQRMALDNQDSEKGLAAARAIAMLSYRSYESFVNSQTDDDEKTDDFKASSYQNHQGEKLVKRFNADAYYVLSKAMDSHNVGRGRESIQKALAQIKSKTVVIGINSDNLFPLIEQEFIAENIPDGSIETIDSLFGHDGFLIEYDQLTEIFRNILKT
jgi:homoserine O-acetyltransferase